MSNLADKFITAGFETEASECCRKAIQLTDCDKRVYEAMTRVKKAPEAEIQKESKMLTRAEPIQRFYGAYGKALSLTTIKKLAAIYKKENSDYTLSITVTDSIFTAKGTYEVSQKEASSAYLLGGSGGTSKPGTKVTRFAVEYRGRLQGCGVQGQVKVEEIDEEKSPFKSLLGSFTKDQVSEVFMVFSEDGKECSVMELEKEKDPSFYKLFALTDGEALLLR